MWGNLCPRGKRGRAAETPAAADSSDGRMGRAEKLAMKRDEVETLTLKINATNQYAVQVATQGQQTFGALTRTAFFHDKFVAMSYDTLKELKENIEASNGEQTRVVALARAALPEVFVVIDGMKKAMGLVEQFIVAKMYIYIIEAYQTAGNTISWKDYKASVEQVSSPRVSCRINGSYVPERASNGVPKRLKNMC